MLALLLEKGDLEEGTRILIQKFIKPGDVFVDVGANIGMHTVAAARALEGKGKVIAFEPYSLVENLLCKTLYLNGLSDLVEVHRVAVSNKTGIEGLYLGNTCGHNSLYRLNENFDDAQNIVDVQLDTLDNLLVKENHINLMKIDVEGAELDVIEGSSSIISKNPDIAIIVEFGPSHILRVGLNINQWMSTFEELGMECRVINAITGSLEIWSPELLEGVESVNLFFARPGSSVWSRLEKCH